MCIKHVWLVLNCLCLELWKLFIPPHHTSRSHESVNRVLFGNAGGNTQMVSFWRLVFIVIILVLTTHHFAAIFERRSLLLSFSNHCLFIRREDNTCESWTNFSQYIRSVLLLLQSFKSEFWRKSIMNSLNANAGASKLFSFKSKGPCICKNFLGCFRNGVLCDVTLVADDGKRWARLKRPFSTRWWI